MRQKLSRLDQADAHPLPQFLPENQKQKSPKNPGFGPTKTRVSGFSKLGKNPGKTRPSEPYLGWHKLGFTPDWGPPFEAGTFQAPQLGPDQLSSNGANWGPSQNRPVLTWSQSSGAGPTEAIITRAGTTMARTSSAGQLGPGQLGPRQLGPG